MLGKFFITCQLNILYVFSFAYRKVIRTKLNICLDFLSILINNLEISYNFLCPVRQFRFLFLNFKEKRTAKFKGNHKI